MRKTPKLMVRRCDLDHGLALSNVFPSRCCPEPGLLPEQRIPEHEQWRVACPRDWTLGACPHLPPSLLTDEDHRLDCLCPPIPLVDRYLTILFMLDITHSRVAVMPTPEAVTSLQVCLMRHLRVWKLMSFSIDTPAESSPSTRCPVGRDVCHFHLSPHRLNSSLATELPRPPRA